MLQWNLNYWSWACIRIHHHAAEPSFPHTHRTLRIWSLQYYFFPCFKCDLKGKRFAAVPNIQGRAVLRDFRRDLTRSNLLLNKHTIRKMGTTAFMLLSVLKHTTERAWLIWIFVMSSSAMLNSYILTYLSSPVVFMIKINITIKHI